MLVSQVIRTGVRGSVLLRHASTLSTQKSSGSSEKPTNILNTEKVEATLEEKTGICRLAMKNAPVNVLEKEVLTNILDIAKEANETSNINAIVISSALPKMFSGGLDIKTMLRADKDESGFRDYWKTMQDVLCTLYMNKAVTVAAIEGTCIAGGLLLAASCDYRITTEDKHKFGFMETSLAVDIPVIMSEMFKEQVGLRESMVALQYGKMYDVSSAHRAGYVEEMCAPGELDHTVNRFLKKALSVHSEARQKTKRHLRQETFRVIQESLDVDTDEKYKTFSRPDIKQFIQNYLAKTVKKT